MIGFVLSECNGGWQNSRSDFCKQIRNVLGMNMIYNMWYFTVCNEMNKFRDEKWENMIFEHSLSYKYHNTSHVSKSIRFRPAKLCIRLDSEIIAVINSQVWI